MLNHARLLLLVGFIAFLTAVQQSGGETATDYDGDRPVLVCTDDTLAFPGEPGKTCLLTEFQDAVTYRWYGTGLVSGDNSPCAEWTVPGIKQIDVLLLKTGEVLTGYAVVHGPFIRFSGVPIIPDVPRPLAHPLITDDAYGSGTNPSPAVVVFSPFPNPFNPATRIDFHLDADSWIRVRILNSLGQEVARLVDEPISAGLHHAIWDGQTADGREVPSGTYFCQITGSGSNHFIKLLLVQ